jgi:glycosyltransferase involved in cell wall biosynthesis
MTQTLLIQPPAHGRLSGGYRYNQALVREAADAGFPLSVREVNPLTATAAEWAALSAPVMLWDSLYLERLASTPPPLKQAVHGLLVHYLPWLNPRLSEGAQTLWANRFDAAVRRMDGLIVTGEGTQALLQRRYPALPVYFCEPGVDAEFSAARQAVRDRQPAGPVNIITVGNLLPAKRPLELLTLLARQDADWVWHLAGDDACDPAYARHFRAYVDQLGLSRRCHLHGPLAPAQLARLLATMDLFVSYSCHESYGMALAEAAAAGLPALTTAVGDADRLVVTGETGLVVPADDAPAFAAGLQQLLGDGALRHHFRQGLAAVRPHLWQQTFSRFAAAVESLAGH